MALVEIDIRVVWLYISVRGFPGNLFLFAFRRNVVPLTRTVGNFLEVVIQTVLFSNANIYLLVTVDKPDLFENVRDKSRVRTLCARNTRITSKIM